MASISIRDRILLGEHFVRLLEDGKAKSQLALSRKYGVSGSWVRSICEMVNLAPEIKTRIDAMANDDVDRLIRFRELFDISQFADHGEQVRRFTIMVERNGNSSR